MSTKPLTRTGMEAKVRASTSATMPAGKQTPLGDRFVLVQVSPSGVASGSKPVGKVSAREDAKTLIQKAASALKRPGIDREAVFSKAGKTGSKSVQRVFAYSAAPGRPGWLLRESADGTQAIGKFDASGRFRSVRSRD